MAVKSVRIAQRGAAVNRLTEAANAAADALGVDRADIPTYNREPDHLATLQIDAVAGLLERIAGSAAPAKTDDTAKDDDAAKPATADADTTRRATKPAQATKGR